MILSLIFCIETIDRSWENLKQPLEMLVFSIMLCALAFQSSSCTQTAKAFDRFYWGLGVVGVPAGFRLEAGLI